MTNTKTPAATEAVRRAGKKYAKLTQQRKDALEELLAAIRAADAAGEVSRAELVAASGLARQTVWNALDVKR